MAEEIALTWLRLAVGCTAVREGWFGREESVRTLSLEDQHVDF